MSGQFATQRAPGSGVLRATCLACGAVTRQPDKGIGRANIAAWKTRHQHLEGPQDAQGADLRASAPQSDHRDHRDHRDDAEPREDRRP